MVDTTADLRALTAHNDDLRALGLEAGFDAAGAARRPVVDHTREVPASSSSSVTAAYSALN